MKTWSIACKLVTIVPLMLNLSGSAGSLGSSLPLAGAQGQTGRVTKSRLEVERLSPALSEIVPADASLETVASGFTWTEGPIWIPDGYLLFAEITSNSIRKLTPAGDLTTFMQPSGYKGTEPYGGQQPGSNGMTLDRQGRLTVAGHAQRDIYRLEKLSPGAQITVLADTYQGKKLNSPNDLTYRSDGSLYFTDPPYGLRRQDESDPAKELPFSGVYRIPNAEQQKAGTQPNRAALQLLIRDLPRPNGIVFSPDESFLYVDNTLPKMLWMRYPVHADGSLGTGTVFFDATSDKRSGRPDGMKVDVKGNLYSSGPGGIWIFSPQGEHLGTLLLPEVASNVGWGGPDAKTLYITMSSTVRRVRLNIAGMRPGKKS